MPQIRRLLLALLALALLAAAPARAADGPSSQSFGAIENCPSQYFQVPAGVTAVTVEAWGGSGGFSEHTGAGGSGADVRASVAVTPGESLSVVVGTWGDSHGGCGLAQGGDRGDADGADHSGRDGYGGGNGSVVERGSTPLVVAGGGGGGGGNGNSSGGGGGAAGNPPQLGWMGNGNGGYGGCAACIGGWQGDSGDDQSWGWGGGGGGGGGGYPQSGGGGQANASGGGGGGGAGGSFATDPQALIQSSARACVWPDYSPACDGAVTISWDVTPASVTASGGSGQQTDAGTGFAQRLQATVRNAEGQPLENAAVVFALPASGPSASWSGGAAGSAPVTASTDADGVAVSPLLRANDAVGAWSATATAGGARSATFTLTNTRADTTTRVSSSADPSVAGQPVTFTATITSSSTAGEAWGGMVRFFDGGVQLGSAVAVAPNGTATSPPFAFGSGASALGDHQITALFSGDPDHDPSAAAAYDQRVLQAPTATTVTSSVNPALSGQAPVVTAAVSTHSASPLTPSGTVQFAYATQPGGTPVALGGPVALDGAGVATAPLPALADGAYDVTAAFTGSASFGSSAGSFVESVGPDATATTLASSVNPAVFGEPFELTATVARSGPGAEPSGAVTFTTDGQTLCDAIALGTPVPSALCSWSHALTPGGNLVAAAFADPAAQYEPSNGTITQQVTAAATATTLTAVPASTAYGTPLRLRATVAVVAPGVGLPDGTIQFSADGAPFGAPVAVVRGVALSPPLSTLTPGPHTLGADYADDSVAPRLQLLPSRGGTTHVVTPAPTTLALASGLDPAQAGEAVVFTATPSVGGSAPAVAGDVQFLVDGAPLGAPVAIAGGVARSAATSRLKPGVHTVTAELNGGADFLPAAATLRQTVTALPVRPVEPLPPAGPAPPLGPVPPAQAVVAIGGGRVVARADGVVRIPLTCSGPAGGRCVGGVRLTSAARLPANLEARAPPASPSAATATRSRPAERRPSRCGCRRPHRRCSSSAAAPRSWCTSTRRRAPPRRRARSRSSRSTRRR